MQNFSQNRSSFVGSISRVSYDTGLRAYMLKIYNFMSIALAISGFIALLASQSASFMHLLFGTPLSWVVMLAPLGFVMFFGYKLNSISAAQAKTYLWIYSALMGLSLSFIFIAYTQASIARVFFITASVFGAMSFYGYTTKKDLTGLGSFLMMGLIGIIIASLVNIFLKSSALDFVVSIIGVLIFVGMTAYDTQRLKQSYYAAADEETATKIAVMGALSLYMDFINLFMQLLRFFGDRRN